MNFANGPPIKGKCPNGTSSYKCFWKKVGNPLQKLAKKCHENTYQFEVKPTAQTNPTSTMVES